MHSGNTNFSAENGQKPASAQSIIEAGLASISQGHVPFSSYKDRVFAAALLLLINKEDFELLDTSKLVASQAALHTGLAQLLQQGANVRSALVDIRNQLASTGDTAAAQAQLDQLTTNMDSDTSDITKGISDDQTVLTPPAPGPIDGTGGATGDGAPAIGGTT